jgi:hypothetical protein
MQVCLIVCLIALIVKKNTKEKKKKTICLYTVQKRKRKLYFSKFKHYIYTAFVKICYFSETKKNRLNFEKVVM